ncbi:MAG: hypothetical protein AAF630_01445 [Cyanobacteria bacterium P01_C01_bin.38]
MGIPALPNVSYRLHLLTGANFSSSICKVDDTDEGFCLQLNYFVGEINLNLPILPSKWHSNRKAFQDW